MIKHNYTLEKIVEEFKTLMGCRLAECFTQEKDSLMMGFDDGNQIRYIQLYTDPNLASILLRENFARARKNSTNLFHEAIGEPLQDISLDNSDRIITFSFVHSKIIIMLFSGPNSNAILLNNDNKIINAFKSGRKLIDTEYKAPEANLKNIKDFGPNNKIIDALKRSGLLLGKHYAEEFLSRKGIGPEVLIGNLSPDEMLELNNEAYEFRREILKSDTYYLLEADKKKLLLSLIPLAAIPKIYKEYSNINEAMQERIIHALQYEGFYSIYKQLYSQLTRLEKKLANNIEMIKNDEKSIERSENYKKWAELLVSQPNPKLRPGDSVKLYDWDGAEIEIPLDKKLDLLGNSAKYFNKSRNTKESIAHRKKLIPQKEKRLAEAREKLKLLDKAITVKELQKLKQSSRKIHGVQMNDKNRDRSEKFRQFDLGEGFTLYVGKSASDNDELTMKFASPNDLWFHARGAQGSHCVIKLEKNQKVPKYIVKKAASIAAYYSKAKNAGYTPVSYTFKKYVRKPKGSNVGSVVISREEVVMVKPGLPSAIDN